MTPAICALLTGSVRLHCYSRYVAKTCFHFALSGHSHIRPEEQRPEYKATVFPGAGLWMILVLFVCMCFLQQAWVTSVIRTMAITALKISDTWSTLYVLSISLCSIQVYRPDRNELAFLPVVGWLRKCGRAALESWVSCAP